MVTDRGIMIDYLIALYCEQYDLERKGQDEEA